MLLVNNLLPKDLKNINLKMEFMRTVEYIFEKNPKVAECLKEIDGKSSTTYSHSVNVAFHVYEMISQNKEFHYTPDEIKRWTEAALVHDTGKLTTNNEVLHSKAKMRGETISKEQDDLNFSHMMRHSLDGLKKGLDFQFEKESISAIIGHHVKAEFLDKGPAGGFEGASLSKKEWIQEFGEGYIESLLMEHCSWMTEKDIFALKTISFCDELEATRATDRSYTLQHYWDKDDFTKNEFGLSHGLSVENVIKQDVSNNVLSPIFKDIALDKQFQAHFDDLQKLEAHKELKDLIAEYTKDVKVKVYEDKAKEIQENPELGQLFFEEKIGKDGHTYFVFEHESLSEPVVIKKEGTIDIVREVPASSVEEVIDFDVPEIP